MIRGAFRSDMLSRRFAGSAPKLKLMARKMVNTRQTMLKHLMAESWSSVCYLTLHCHLHWTELFRTGSGDEIALHMCLVSKEAEHSWETGQRDNGCMESQPLLHHTAPFANYMFDKLEMRAGGQCLVRLVQSSCYCSIFFNGRDSGM